MNVHVRRTIKLISIAQCIFQCAQYTCTAVKLQVGKKVIVN